MRVGAEIYRNKMINICFYGSARHSSKKDREAADD